VRRFTVNADWLAALSALWSRTGAIYGEFQLTDALMLMMETEPKW
jgi:hypothetical protein